MNRLAIAAVLSFLFMVPSFASAFDEEDEAAQEQLRRVTNHTLASHLGMTPESVEFGPARTFRMTELNDIRIDEEPRPVIQDRSAAN